MRHSHIGSIATLSFLCCVAQTLAEVRLPAVLSDNMMVQRDVPMVIWGWTEPNEKVTVQCGEASVTIDGHDGKWQVKLPAQAAGPVPNVTVTGSNTITISNILAGDLWFCSGQSNMQWLVKNSNHAEEEIAAADYPMMRSFTSASVTADQPQEDVKGSWVIVSPQTAGNLTAVGYFFGRELHQRLNVPIGLVNSSWGGTPAEAWTPIATLQADADYATILERARTYPEQYPGLVEKYKADLIKWQEAVDKAKAEGKPEPRKPEKPSEPGKHPNLASVLYNAKVHPLTPLPIKGVIWYQGEANTGRAYQYRKLMADLIVSWRQAWNQPELPFAQVQLANHKSRKTVPGESQWAELREAQAMVASKLPMAGLAVTIDIGKAYDIHPRNKQDVGKRLAAWAIHSVYVKNEVVPSGPQYQAIQVVGSQVYLSFNHIGSGLMVKGDELKGFALTGDDQKWHWATAGIEGDKVIVQSEAVPAPVAVRYAWADNPECNLYNKEGLPAVPFRSDDWRMSTRDNK